MRAPPGLYRLEMGVVSASAAATDQGSAIEVRNATIRVLPCGLGELPLTYDQQLGAQKFTCQRCATGSLSLWHDPAWGVLARPVFDERSGWSELTACRSGGSGGSGGGRGSAGGGEAGVGVQSQCACLSCPDHAFCPGGAVVLPEPGWWQSSHSSLIMHRCLNPSACGGDDANQTGLWSCQQAWYDNVTSAAIATGTLDLHDNAPTCLWQPYDTALAAAAGLGGGAGNGTPKTTADGAPSATTMSYMQMQCAPGYTGHLCAACQPHYFVNSDFECRLCPSVARTALVGVAAFLSSVAVVSWSLFATFKDNYWKAEDSAGGGEPSVGASEVLKVVIVHVQYFIIITRLNIRWPRSILRFQAFLASVMGAENQFAFSTSCLKPSGGHAWQARAQLFGALIIPAIVTLVAMGLWLIRCICFNVGRMKRQGALGRNRDAKGFDHLALHDVRVDSWVDPASCTGGAPSVSHHAAGSTVASVPVTPAASLPPSPTPLKLPSPGSAPAAGAGAGAGAGVLPLPSAANDSMARSASLHLSPSIAAADASSPTPPAPIHTSPSITAPADVSVKSKSFQHSKVPAADAEDGGADQEWASFKRGPPVSPGGGFKAKAKAMQAKLVQMVAVQHGAALTHIDQALSVRDQMFLAVAVFVLYPGWANAAFSVFACVRLDPGSGDHAENQRATWHYGYWIRDMTQECYQGIHAGMYLPVGIVSILLFCFGPPVINLIVLWRNRKELHERHMLQTYGFMYHRFRPSFFYWESVLQLETLALVSADVFGRTLPPHHRALMLLLVLLSIAIVNMSASALHHRLLITMEFLSLSFLSVTVALSLFFVEVDNTSRDEVSLDAVGVCIIVMNTLLIIFFLGVMLFLNRTVVAQNAKAVGDLLLKRRRRAAAYAGATDNNAGAVPPATYGVQGVTDSTTSSYPFRAQPSGGLLMQDGGEAVRTTGTSSSRGSRANTNSNVNLNAETPGGS